MNRSEKPSTWRANLTPRFRLLLRQPDDQLQMLGVISLLKSSLRTPTRTVPSKRPI